MLNGIWILHETPIGTVFMCIQKKITEWNGNYCQGWKRTSQFFYACNIFFCEIYQPKICKKDCCINFFKNAYNQTNWMMNDWVFDHIIFFKFPFCEQFVLVLKIEFLSTIWFSFLKIAKFNLQWLHSFILPFVFVEYFEKFISTEYLMAFFIWWYEILYKVGWG